MSPPDPFIHHPLYMTNQEYTTIGVWVETADQLTELKRQRYNSTAVPTTQVMDDLISDELEDN